MNLEFKQKLKTASIQTKYQPSGNAIYNVIQDRQLMKSFYCKKQAKEMRDTFNLYAKLKAAGKTDDEIILITK
jgi:hypothetical protein